MIKQLARANRALAELKGYADTILNKNILINAVMIKESKDSSAIEKNRVGIRKLHRTVIRNESTGEIVYTPPEGEENISLSVFILFMMAMAEQAESSTYYI